MCRVLSEALYGTAEFADAPEEGWSGFTKLVFLGAIVGLVFVGIRASKNMHPGRF